ncbi:flagellar basal body rod protein FlgB [candidate division KSB1 bacterium]|nr:flagellar basal body rod protein FlgB [candidate division KSB1 bacterium]
MKFSPLEKTLVPLLRQSLDAYNKRHTAIAENISNVATKGYRPLKVHFEEELRQSLEKNKPVGKTSDPRHMAIGGTTKSVKASVEELNARVNIESEMAELAQNQIRFNFVTRMLRRRYDTIKTSIRGRLA